MKFGDWIRKGLGYRFTSHPPRESKLRIMAGVIRLGAMASRFATAPHNSGDRTAPKITEAEKLLEEFGSFGFQGSKRIRHAGLQYERLYTLRSMAQKKNFH